jgi:predicted MFS family arabinose efflux permease
VVAGAASSAGPLNRRLQIISAAFALVLIPPLLAGSIAEMAVIMFVAGLPIAPSVAVSYNMLERAAVPGTQAEVFGWMSTSVTIGLAAGTAAGGSLIAHTGVHAALTLGIAGAAVACALSFTPEQ